MPAKARVECAPEFQSAASLRAGAACGVRLALLPSDSAQPFEITRILNYLTPSDERFSVIVEWASSRLKTAKVQKKTLKPLKTWGRRQNGGPKKLAFWRKSGLERRRISLFLREKRP